MIKYLKVFLLAVVISFFILLIKDEYIFNPTLATLDILGLVGNCYIFRKNILKFWRSICLK